MGMVVAIATVICLLACLRVADVLKVLCGILATLVEQHLLAAGVVVEVLAHVVHLVVDDDPNVLAILVSRHIRQRAARKTGG